MGRKPTYAIRSNRQLSVLASGPRQEIVDVLEKTGEASVAELAAVLGRPADALYFHLRHLRRAGLVLDAGYRRRGGRKEKLFRIVAPELQLKYDPSNKHNRKRVTAIVESMFRLATRDFKRAFRFPGVIVSGNRRQLWALRKTGRLSKAEVINVNRAIKDLVGRVSNRGRSGRLYAITVLLTPLDRQEGRKSAFGLKDR